jgi:hypothetical protein
MPSLDLDRTALVLRVRRRRGSSPALQGRLFDSEGVTERKQNSTATCGIGCGMTPPPITSDGLLPGGRMRRRSPCPVPRRRGWRRRARASGAIRVCLGGSWGQGESLRLIGRGIYRAERRGRGCPEARRLGGPGNARRSYRARRPRGHAGRVLARPRSAVGRCWRGQGGRERAEKKKTGRGPWAQFSSSLRFSWLRSG